MVTPIGRGPSVCLISEEMRNKLQTRREHGLWKISCRQYPSFDQPPLTIEISASLALRKFIILRSKVITWEKRRILKLWVMHQGEFRVTPILL